MAVSASSKSLKLAHSVSIMVSGISVRNSGTSPSVLRMSDSTSVLDITSFPSQHRGRSFPLHRGRCRDKAPLQLPTRSRPYHGPRANASRSEDPPSARFHCHLDAVHSGALAHVCLLARIERVHVRVVRFLLRPASLW